MGGKHMIFRCGWILMRPLKGGGGPRLPAPFEIRPFSPGSLNYFLDAPQNNFSCPLHLFRYLPAPSTFVILFPELKISPEVYNCCIYVLKCGAKRGENFLWYKTPWFYGTLYAPCSLNYFLLLPAPWSFLHPVPGSLVVLDPILPAPLNPLWGLTILKYMQLSYYSETKACMYLFSEHIAFFAKMKPQPKEVSYSLISSNVIVNKGNGYCNQSAIILKSPQWSVGRPAKIPTLSISKKKDGFLFNNFFHFVSLGLVFWTFIY